MHRTYKPQNGAPFLADLSEHVRVRPETIAGVDELVQEHRAWLVAALSGLAVGPTPIRATPPTKAELEAEANVLAVATVTLALALALTLTLTHIDARPAVIAQHGAYGGGAVEEAHVALAAAVRAEAALRVLVRVRVRVRVTVRVRVRVVVRARVGVRVRVRVRVGVRIEQRAHHAERVCRERLPS